MAATTRTKTTSSKQQQPSFAMAYADQTERDYEALATAARQGRIAVADVS